MKNTKEFLNEINDFAIGCANLTKEVVDVKSAIMAQYIISHINIENVEDILLFCISNNLLNTYVKQKDSLIGYYFKQSVFKLLGDIKNTDNLDLKLSFQRDKDMTLLVVCLYDEIQFSFHGVAKVIESLIPSQYSSNIVWDAVRKQMCAVSLFNKVKDFLIADEKYRKLFSESSSLADAYINSECSYKYIKDVCKFL